MSAIVVAGGVSKRFGQDKALVKLADKPLVSYVVDKALSAVDNVTVVVNSEAQKRRIAEVISKKARIMVDYADIQTPLVGALTGFEAAQAEYAILLACDTVFLSPEILSLILEVSTNRNAAIPRWPNGNIEPLHAAYHVPTAAKAAEAAIENGKLDMRTMVDNMRNVRYISTMVLRQLDPKLTTFFNINSPNDLRQAEATIKRHVY